MLCMALEDVAPRPQAGTNDQLPRTKITGTTAPGPGLAARRETDDQVSQLCTETQKLAAVAEAIG